MKKLFLISTFLLSIVRQSSAQQFLDEAVVEYEVKTNIKKTLGGGFFAEMMKDLPQFRTGYYNLSFSGNKSLYKFDRWDPKEKIPEFMLKSDEAHVWFYDYNNGKYSIQKDIAGAKFNIEDSIKKITWHLDNENRIIAGFNCRKAVGKIMDSVYVFAFYTDEILLTGGPVSVNGLPGLILGLTIPRLYTSFIATKVSLFVGDKSAIKPPDAKKYQSAETYKKEIQTRIKEWTSEGNDEESKQFINQFLWGALL